MPGGGVPLCGDDPSSVGGYRLSARLGCGGMGVVYLGHAADGGRVAVKVIVGERAADPEWRARFLREVANARRVARFCTAPVLDAGVDGDRPYLVTEYVPGPTLAQVVRDEGPLAGSDLEGLAVGTAAALTAIHAAGLVHRDLKPGNVLMSPVGPRVIDFGIARYLGDATGPWTTKLALGTPGYVAPELCTGGSPVTAAADVFAWGGVIAFAGTGRSPFGDGDPHSVLYRIVHGEPDLDKLDDQLRPLVAAATAKDPARRPGAHELLSRLCRASTVEPTTVPALLERGWTPTRSPADGRTLTEIEPPVRAGAPAGAPESAAQASAGRTSPAAPRPFGRTLTKVEPPAGAVVWASADQTAPMVRGQSGRTLTKVEPPVEVGTEASADRTSPPVREPSGRILSRRRTAVGAAVLVAVLLAAAGVVAVTRPVGRAAACDTTGGPGDLHAAIALDQTVSRGTPCPAAGTLEPAGAMHSYTFTGRAGQTIFPDRPARCGQGLHWALYDPGQRTAFNARPLFDRAICDGFPGPVQLPLDGTYELRIRGDGTATAGYEFRLRDAQPRRYQIKIGDQVAPGSPAPGAGTIPSPGVVETYAFDAPRGQLVFLQRPDTCLKDDDVRWSLRDANGTSVLDSDSKLMCADGDLGPLALALGGHYQISVYRDDNATATYSFTLRDATGRSYQIAIGDSIGPDSPQPGMGAIDQPGVTNAYAFDANQGQQVSLTRPDSCDTNSQLRWALRTPDGRTLFDQAWCSGGNAGPLTLDTTGTYGLYVYGSGPATGTYSFQLTGG
jgi:hypothetical protein